MPAAAGAVPPIDASALVRRVAPATYGDDSGSAYVFNAVNALREKLGSGLLTQNPKLDRAALAHHRYMGTNPLVNMHAETPGKPAFTGVDATARGHAAGYGASYIEEVIYGSNGADKFAGCAPSWANSIYHVGLFFSGMRDVGIAALATRSDSGLGRYTVCVVNFSLDASKVEQLPEDGTIRVYPYPDQTRVPTVFYNHTEEPSPLPEYFELGPPVTLSFKTKSFLESGAKPAIIVDHLSIATASGQPLGAKILVSPVGGISTRGPALRNDEMIAPFTLTIVPVARMKPNAVYTVSFAGIVNGNALSKTWKFSTGER
ncbi:MAG TPA: CAP domain-containing protein [Duganella sp.]|nr:CAP domain-containing protein [Duganella sp.]